MRELLAPVPTRMRRRARRGLQNYFDEAAYISATMPTFALAGNHDR